MVETTAWQYDNGGVGDGNLTQTTDFVGGGTANRLTQYFYDWRDRLVATKSGVQYSEDDGVNRPIVYTTYDNLNEAVEVQQYTGDGVSITTTDGVPDAPDASLLRAQKVYAYDNQGRVYQTQVYDVDPSNRGRIDERADDELLLRPSRRPDRHIGPGRPMDEEPLRRGWPRGDGLHDRRSGRHDVGGGDERGRRPCPGASADGARRRRQRYRDYLPPAVRQRHGHGTAGHTDERHRCAGLLRGDVLRRGGSADGRRERRHQRRHRPGRGRTRSRVRPARFW